MERVQIDCIKWSPEVSEAQIWAGPFVVRYMLGWFVTENVVQSCITEVCKGRNEKGHFKQQEASCWTWRVVQRSCKLFAVKVVCIFFTSCRMFCIGGIWLERRYCGDIHGMPCALKLVDSYGSDILSRREPHCCHHRKLQAYNSGRILYLHSKQTIKSTQRIVKYWAMDGVLSRDDVERTRAL